ncbi:gephyrin-like molybdotransferase Glp [Fervidibacillus albus]|uniref:Molybdopterin molybdenumtransferase n=1 Tax=Fervidibacillus albus TaxID=2980026 RepID=A0A9E8LTP1_9BACI|nr:gephyrin-like molybdotransferase Glp [Fervidibacillus albus]WAA09336.1 molybdopterin molybdotransferase MoeA [Fervidibacillus albus]
MLERRKPITVSEAVRRVMQYKKKGTVEFVPIEQSYGRTLGQDLIATHDVPFFDRSPYDGYAIVAEDTEHASRNQPVCLEVVGKIGAGSVFQKEMQPGQAVRIMTGAAIPTGANAVIMLELVEEVALNDKTYIHVKHKMKPGDNISSIGEDTKKGTVLSEKGSVINPGITALLATFGYRQVPVGKKPTIGIIATGSELLDITDPLQPGKIRNSNAYMITAQIERAGGVPMYFGQFTDQLDLCYEQVADTLDKVDFLITTGGVSVGDYDYLPEIYRKLGANVLFNKIGMRPGSVTTVAQLNGKLLFGLSGNPSACYVGFELFVRPIIRTFLHAKKPFAKKTVAELGSDFSKPNPFTRFVRGSLSLHQGKLICHPVGLDKSNVVSSLANTNVLIVLPGGTKGYTKGTTVTVILLEDQEGTEEMEF